MTASIFNALAVDMWFVSVCHQIVASYHYLGQKFLEIDRMFGYSKLSSVRERLVEAKMQLLIYQHGQMIEYEIRILFDNFVRELFSFPG
jgi:hypothetical protein